MPNIMHRLKIQAPPDRVYQAISTAEGIRGWWTRDADIDPREGGIAVFRFPNYGPGKQTRVEIVHLEPGCRLSWKTVDSLHPQWLGTTIDFVLEEEAGNTEIAF